MKNYQLTHTGSQIDAAVDLANNAQPKIPGKSLSTNDYTTEEKNKLAGIAVEAEVNQNTFSNIAIGTSTIAANAKTDTLTIIAGTNVTITADVANDTFTINATDTTYDEAVYNQLGLVKSGSSMTMIDDSFKPCPIVDGVPYYSILDTPREIELYGIKISKTVQADSPDSSQKRCEYMYDCVNYTPAQMNYQYDHGMNPETESDDMIDNSFFEYGSWNNAFFVKNNYPVMCKYDGTEDYKLWSENQLIKDTEGHAESSDILDTDYPGNAMSCFDCTIWIKRWEDNSYEYYAVSNYQLDEGFKNYPYIRADGSVASKLYYPMFKGSIIDGKLRSIGGIEPTGNTTATEEVAACTSTGENWQICDWAHREWLNVLLMLMACTDNMAEVYGYGHDFGSDKLINPCFWENGDDENHTLIKKGQFYGYKRYDYVDLNGDGVSYASSSTKVFYIEDWWGERWDRCLGLWNDKGTYKVKWTPQYSIIAPEEDAITVTEFSVPSGTAHQKQMSNTYGRLCVNTGGSSSTYTGDGHIANNSKTCLAVVGGDTYYQYFDGPWFNRYDIKPTDANKFVGASPYLIQPVSVVDTGNDTQTG